MAAPNFGDSNYPMAGERIGPAWQFIWDFLADKKLPLGKQTIIEVAQSAGHDLQSGTIYNLLWQAGRNGLLEVTHQGKTKATYYRRIDMIKMEEES